RLSSVFSDPKRLLVALLGNSILTLGLVFAFDAALRAFGQSVSLIDVAVIYLIGNTVGAAAPTPGGVGAIELVLAASLTATASVPGAISRTVVMLFRFMTYWVRIPIGWVAMHHLQKKGDLSARPLPGPAAAAAVDPPDMTKAPDPYGSGAFDEDCSVREAQASTATRPRCAPLTKRRGMRTVWPSTRASTSCVSVAFHCKRRARVLERDIFRFGTASIVLSRVEILLRHSELRARGEVTYRLIVRGPQNHGQIARTVTCTTVPARSGPATGQDRGRGLWRLRAL